MDLDDMRARVEAARVARLASVRPDGRPHLVPVCFALLDSRVVSIVDTKPKTTTALRRLDNVRANPAVSLLVDHYDDDWTRLWWVRVDGSARIVENGPEHATALDALRAKYAQYRDDSPSGPVLELRVEQWRGWSYTR